MSDIPKLTQKEFDNLILTNHLEDGDIIFIAAESFNKEQFDGITGKGKSIWIIPVICAGQPIREVVMSMSRTAIRRLLAGVKP